MSEVEVKGTAWSFTRVRNNALENPTLSVYDKIVYVALSYFADQAGSSFPSYKRIAEIAGCSRRKAVEAMESLEKQGYVVKKYRGSGKTQTSNIYTVLDGPSAHRAPPSAHGAPPLVHTVHPPSAQRAPELEPINENQLNESNVRSAYSSDFELLWEKYPRKVEKKKAMKAYQARRKEGVKHDDLLVAVENYRGKVAGSEPRFIKHGSTFLGPDEVWKDYLKEEEVVDLIAERVKKRLG